MTDHKRADITPKQIQDWMQAFVKPIGPQADAFVSVNTHGKPLSLSLYPKGICQSVVFRAEADDWADLFAIATEKWAERQSEFSERLIRDMALEIIRITHEFGTCTDASLRSDKWTGEDIARFGAAAVERANVMAANGPFSIQHIQTANAA